MTSKQVMLVPGAPPAAIPGALAKMAIAVLTLAIVVLAGCDYHRGYARRNQRPSAPYEQRQVWAVAPLRNESGSLVADGVRMADHLTQELTLVHGIDTVPVNRVLAAMETLKLAAVTNQGEALALRQALGVDGLVAGTITAWEPYDPPKIGIAIELYLDPVHASRFFDVRKLTGAATEDQVLPGADAPYNVTDQPVSVVSDYYDAADPITRRQLEDYGRRRGIDENFDHSYRLYRISMDLYSEFVSHEVGSRLLRAERVRVTPPEPQQKPDNDPKLTQASPG